MSDISVEEIIEALIVEETIIVEVTGFSAVINPDASEVPITPSGNIVSDNVRDAIYELDVEKLNVNDLSANINLFPTTAASDIEGYSKLVTSTEDPDFDIPAVDINTGVISGEDQLIASLASDVGLIVGDPGIINITIIGNIRRASGIGTASFYFRIFHRDSIGDEVELSVSNSTPDTTSSEYVQFSATALLNNGIFLETDRLVIKFYGSKVAVGVDPTYEFQFGGSLPVRVLLPLPIRVIPSFAEDISTDVSDFDDILSDGDTDLQKVADTLNSHTHVVHKTADSFEVISGEVEAGEDTIDRTFTVNDEWLRVNERSGAGLEVRFNFTVPEGIKAQRAHTIGYYDGNPAHNHNGLAWNFNTASLDVIDGGVIIIDGTSDAIYWWNLTDDHTDTDGSVRIHTRHNVTGYSDAHFIKYNHVAVTYGGEGDATKINGDPVDGADKSDQRGMVYDLATKTIKWITLSGGGGGGEWTDIGPPVVAIAAPFVTYQGLDNTYKKYRIISIGHYCSAYGELRGEIESGGSWKTADYSYQRLVLSTTYSQSNSSSYAHIRLSTGNNVALIPQASLTITIIDPARTDVSCLVKLDYTFCVSATSPPQQQFGSGHWHGGLGAVTGFRLYHNSGTMFGTYQLQGSNRE